MKPIVREGDMISTTLNIHDDKLIKIDRLSREMKKKKRDVIVLLLMRAMSDNRVFRGRFRSVRYQPAAGKEKWNCFHVNFREDEYEYFIDLRKFFKCSVSYILALAVEEYMGEFLEKKDEPMNNYHRYKDYVMHCEKPEGVISWRLYWGFPEEELKKIVRVSRTVAYKSR